MAVTDEDLLIDDAVHARKSHKRGYNLLATLSLAAVFAGIGAAVLFWLRPLVKSIPFLPLGSVTSGLLIIGLVAFGIAALLTGGALLVAGPWSTWGDAVAGSCPQCGKRSLRQEKVQHSGWEDGKPEAGVKKGPRGIVTLCQTRGCGYASAKVTGASAG